MKNTTKRLTITLDPKIDWDAETNGSWKKDNDPHTSPPKALHNVLLMVTVIYQQFLQKYWIPKPFDPMDLEEIFRGGSKYTQIEAATTTSNRMTAFVTWDQSNYFRIDIAFRTGSKTDYELCCGYEIYGSVFRLESIPVKYL
jgi:hypothetical protein